MYRSRRRDFRGIRRLNPRRLRPQQRYARLPCKAEVDNKADSRCHRSAELQARRLRQLGTPDIPAPLHNGGGKRFLHYRRNLTTRPPQGGRPFKRRANRPQFRFRRFDRVLIFCFRLACLWACLAFVGDGLGRAESMGTLAGTRGGFRFENSIQSASHWSG